MFVETTSSDPIEETLPSTLRGDEDMGEPEANTKAHLYLGLLIARGGKRSCADVGTEMTPVSVMDVGRAEYIAVERGDLNDGFMTVRAVQQKIQ